MSLFEIKNKYTSADSLDLDELGFKIAFTAVDYYSLDVLNDPSMVEWVVVLQSYKNLQVVEETPIKYHICTEHDWN